MITISLNDMGEIKEFINIVSTFSSHIDLISGRYIVNAKSIMGVFSLDTTKGMIVRIDSEDETEIQKVTDALRKFM